MSPAKPAADRAEHARLDALLADVTEFDDLDAAYTEIRKPPYGFVWEGQRWVLPHMGSLDWRTQQKIEDSTELGMQEIFDLFTEMFGSVQAARWQATVQPSDKLPLLFDRWLAHSRVKPGEDAASNTSSANIGERSRPTSDVSTSFGSPLPSSVTTVEAPVLCLPESSST